MKNHDDWFDAVLVAAGFTCIIAIMIGVAL